jgi:hypothetical protein
MDLTLRAGSLFIAGLGLGFVGIFGPRSSMCYTYYCPPSALIVALREIGAALMALGVFSATSLAEGWMTHHPAVNRLMTPLQLRLLVSGVIMIQIFSLVLSFYLS